MTEPLFETESTLTFYVNGKKVRRHQKKVTYSLVLREYTPGKHVFPSCFASRSDVAQVHQLILWQQDRS